MFLLVALALLAGTLAYQSPATTDIAVGWLGDRLFLRSSEGAGATAAGSFYGDELNAEARSRRSRWTRQSAAIALPGLGFGGDLHVTLRAQGWPTDVLGASVRQPEVVVAANGVPFAEFTPTMQWADYSFTLPADLRAGNTLLLTLQTSETFTSTAQYADPRPKGIRLEYIGVREPASRLTWPAPLPLLLLLANTGLWMLALLALTRRPTLAFVLVTLLVSGAAIGLALARVWAVVLLPWALLWPALLVIYTWRVYLLGLLAGLLRRYTRGHALNYGLAALAGAWLLYCVVRAGSRLQPPGFQLFRESFPDSLLLGLLGLGVLLLALVWGREGLPRLSHASVGLVGSRRVAPALLALFFAIWIGYMASIVAVVPYVGHADYADNAVVARNLVDGRGWVVDYVTQFYTLYPSLSHPQETWPLLQPVWIAPFFLLFGAQSWAAKLPNLIFIALLGVLVYAAGARLWDRRVGLTAAVIVLTSHLFFKLVLYTTTDLAFVVFSFGALYLLYRAIDDRSSRSIAYRLSSIVNRRLLLSSAVLTGLMLLQKPGSGVMIAGGMGLWMLLSWMAGVRRWQDRTQSNIQHLTATILPIVVWGALALLILSPYLLRNLVLFGTPFYSTESRDAWVQGYTQDWEIYKVYTSEADLSETGGLPNATWILRWGFDRTLRKIADQAAAVRDYLLPPWQGLPLGMSDTFFGRPDKDALLFGVGAWLLILGVLGALGARRRLVGLLLAAFVPYTLFLVVYWHADEERYFVMLLPWLALLAAYALWRAYDRIAAIGDGRWTPVGLALVVTALVMMIGPSWPTIAEKVRAEPQRYAADLDAYDWLRANAHPDDVVMTRNPWQFNWESRLPALMVPHTTNPQTFLRIARYYHVRYLVLDSLQRPPAVVRTMLDSLTKPAGALLERVYTTPAYRAHDTRGQPITMTTEIYRFPANYGGVAELRP